MTRSRHLLSRLSAPTATRPCRSGSRTPGLRTIQACLKDEIKDDLVEAYVDDVVVKTKEAHTLVDNLERTFAALNTF